MGKFSVRLVHRVTREVLAQMELIPENPILEEDGLQKVVINGQIKEELVRVWWPNGEGDQDLYELTTTIANPDTKEKVSKKTIQVGF